MIRRHFVALGLAAFTTFAASMASADWTTADVPSGVYAGYTDGSVFVAGLDKVNTACKSSTINFLRDPAGIQSLALAAFLSGHKLMCNVDKTSCAGDYQVGLQCELVK